MFLHFGANFSRHQEGGHATHPIARPPSCRAGPAASSRLASQLGRRTLGRVQLPDLG
jgi:hypothetical protein